MCGKAVLSEHSSACVYRLVLFLNELGLMLLHWSLPCSFQNLVLSNEPTEMLESSLRCPECSLEGLGCSSWYDKRWGGGTPCMIAIGKKWAVLDPEH